MAMIDKLLLKAIELGASDVHLCVGHPPILRRFGELKRLGLPPLAAPQIQSLFEEMLTPEQRAVFHEDHELDLAYEIPGAGRFRCNGFVHHRGVDVSLRVIMASMPGLERLGIPDIMRAVCENHQGLILVTGPAGSGKSTTLAALVDYINTERAHHVLTVEDPIEYVHVMKRCEVSQRQLGKHTRSYANALRAALREDPNVIVVGELRDLETISLAISAAETGQLVIGTLNTSGAHKTIDRIIDSYPANQQNQIRSMMGESLKAVFAQRLLPRADGAGVALAYELLLGSHQLAALIKDSKTFQIPNLMQTGKARGNRQLDDSLQELVKAGTIAAEAAAKVANNPKLFAHAAPAGVASPAPSAPAAPAPAPPVGPARHK